MPLPAAVCPSTRNHATRIRQAILTAPIGLLPEQFGRQGSTYAGLPEGQLLLAVLEQALCDLQLGPRCDDRRRADVGAFWDAVEWITADEPDVPFAFSWVCGVLELDPGLVRQRVLRPTPIQRPRRTVSGGSRRRRGVAR